MPIRALPSRHLPVLVVFTCAALALPAFEGSCRAGEVQVNAGFTGHASSWTDSGDGAGTVSLRLGYRFLDLVGIYAMGRVGCAGIDDRMLVSISVGAQIWGRLGIARPYLRFGLLHNHEEPWVAVRHQFVGALLGVGDGIRHRTGLEAGVGLDIPLFQRKRWQLVTTLEANASWLTYSYGPAWYWGGGLSFGLNYTT